MNAARRIVLVSGAPGAGKSTLAAPLAARLNFPLLAKDAIKETLFDALGGAAGDLAQSRLFCGAAMETLWTLAAHCPAVVLEANFRPRSAHERARIAALGGAVVEVYCACPREEAARRFAARAAAGVHPAHFRTSLSEEQFGEYATPMGAGIVIEVDTTRAVAVEPLADETLRAFSRG